MGRLGNTDMGSPTNNIIVGILLLLFAIAVGPASEAILAFGVVMGIFLIVKGIKQNRDSGFAKSPITDFGYDTSKPSTYAAFHLAEKGLRHKGASFLGKSIFIFSTYLPLDQGKLLGEYPVNNFVERLEPVLKSQFNIETSIKIEGRYGQPATGKDKKSHTIPQAIYLELGTKVNKKIREAVEITVTDLFRQIDNDWLLEKGFPAPKLHYEYNTETKVLKEDAEKYYSVWASRNSQ